MVDFILVVHKMLVSLQPAHYDNEWVNPWFQKTVRQDNRIHFSFMIFWIPWWRPQRLLLSSCEMYLPKSSTIVNVSILLVIPDCKLINSVRIEFYIDHSAGREPLRLEEISVLFNILNLFLDSCLCFMSKHGKYVLHSFPYACTESYLPSRSCLIV